ncbi:hypothetical protein [Halorubrum sp. AJ67]|uniref:hypothetical protein n=1 Tax=Halorubrum sp. AJ67 TaxID=1173487 RepID=UPI00189691D2|nr:hypothetical protein [Halorubrum sp. AJ67]
MVVSVIIWVARENRLIVVGISKFIFGTQEFGSVGQSGPPSSGMISILSFSKYSIEWFSILIYLVIIAAFGVLFSVRFSSRIQSNSFKIKTEELIFGIGGGGSMLLSLIAPISSKRGWVLVGLLVAPVWDLYTPSDNSFRKVFSVLLVIFLIGNAILVPFSMFSTTAEPPSYTGYDVYHSESTYATSEFTSSVSPPYVVSDVKYFIIEELYRIEVRQKSSCYTSSCEDEYIIWDERYSTDWVSTSGTQINSLDKGKLSTARSIIYDTGNSNIFIRDENNS